jgi:hypothetical protein
MVSSVINSTHAMVCGGNVDGPAVYTNSTINECYFFSFSEQRFVSRVSDSQIARAAPALWVLQNSIAYFWSGRGPAGTDLPSYAKWDMASLNFEYPDLRWKTARDPPLRKSALGRLNLIFFCLPYSVTIAFFCKLRVSSKSRDTIADGLLPHFGGNVYF